MEGLTAGIDPEALVPSAEAAEEPSPEWVQALEAAIALRKMGWVDLENEDFIAFVDHLARVLSITKYGPHVLSA